MYQYVGNGVGGGRVVGVDKGGVVADGMSLGLGGEVRARRSLFFRVCLGLGLCMGLCARVQWGLCLCLCSCLRVCVR